MSEIDVSKCEYYNDYYKTCSNFSRFGDDEPYCDPKEFKCSYYVNNVEKQLQQLKAENEELRILNKANADNYVKWRDKIEAENEELRKSNTSNAKAFLKENKEKHKLLDCLDEIEELIETCNNTMHCKDCKFSENCQYRNGWGWREIVHQKIKQVVVLDLIVEVNNEKHR